MKYLVTGATGFIGAALVRRLVQEGHTVHCLDNNFRGSVSKLGDAANKVKMFEGDIRDAAVVLKAAEGVDEIIHLAYVNGTEFFYSMPELVLDVAVKGMVNVLEAARHHKIRRFVLASSSEVYQAPPQVPTAEDAPLSVPDVLNPRYSYGGGKIICELMAINYGRTLFDRVTIFRPHNVYGPNMGWEHVIPQFAIRAAELTKGKSGGTIEFPIQGDGLQTRSFIYIDDFTDAVMKVVEKGEHLNIYHLGTMEERSIAEIASAVVKEFGFSAEIKAGAAAPGGVLRRCPDTKKIQSLGFKPKTSFAEGLAKTVAWYKNNLHLRPPPKEKP